MPNAEVCICIYPQNKETISEGQNQQYFRKNYHRFTNITLEYWIHDIIYIEFEMKNLCLMWA